MTQTLTREDSNTYLYYSALLEAKSDIPSPEKFAPFGDNKDIAYEMFDARKQGEAKLKLYFDSLRKIKSPKYKHLIQILSGNTPQQAEAVSNIPQQAEARNVPQFPRLDNLTPPLPEGVAFPPETSAGACKWLDDYIQLSQKWSPRGYELFHTATGVWLLSGIAARRVWLPFGPDGEYTPLFIALVAQTTQHAKSTTASIGKKVLRQSGLSWLLGSDTITPQKLLSNMAGRLPENFQALPSLEQTMALKRYGMSAQVMWFYDEFGQHLDAMTAKNGIMADFKGMLRRFDDCDEETSNDTISRGLERIEKPYMALLASMTPADAKPYTGKDAKFWRDGLFARFAFITPPAKDRNRERFPQGEMQIPQSLIDQLTQWHEALEEPKVHLTEKTDSKGQVTGYDLEREPLAKKTCTLGRGVIDAYYTYSDALDDIVLNHQLEQLAGNYGRMAKKALRMAMIFASLENNGHIEIRHWAKGQEIAETWRASLHELYAQVNISEKSEASEAEDDILRIVRKLTAEKHPPTAREVQCYLKRYDTPTLRDKLRSLTLAGVLREIREGKAERYAVIESEGL